LKNAGMKNGKIRTFSRVLNDTAIVRPTDTTQQSIDNNTAWISDLEALIDCTENHPPPELA
jgi:predicted transcriptional regulator